MAVPFLQVYRVGRYILERRLRGIGVIDALQAHGFEPGDEVEIAGVAFDLEPE